MLTKEEQLKHNKKPKQKRCKNESCKKLFTPERNMQPCCSYSCETEYATKNVAKLVEDGKKLRARESNKKKKELKSKDKQVLIKLAQVLVNKYVRLRDQKKPCVSCGTYQAKWDAGHFFSQGGNSSIRFNTLNIHKQCFRCNRMLSANLVPYKIEIVKRIGQTNFDKLEAKRNDIAKYNVEYLDKLIKVFRKKIKYLETK